MGRPRGFIDNWQPRPHVKELIDNVAEILQGSTILPLTLRQIFYMLVSNYAFEKTERDYKRLCETMNRARRARMISMDDIRDDGLTRKKQFGWNGQEGFIRFIREEAKNFVADRHVRQPIKLFLWCEAGGMVPQLAAAVKEYQVPVISSGGFDSVTTKHKFAKEISRLGEVVILHLGDHDPSGVHMFGSLDEDLQAFVDYYGGEVTLKRIAVTPEQVKTMGLPTSPPKPTDRRSFTGLTTQCEAIPPSRLREIVIDEVESYIAFKVHSDTLEYEEKTSRNLLKILNEVF